MKEKRCWISEGGILHGSSFDFSLLVVFMRRPSNVDTWSNDEWFGRIRYSSSEECSSLLVFESLILLSVLYDKEVEHDLPLDFLSRLFFKIDTLDDGYCLTC